MEQVSERKKPTAGVDLFVCALRVNGVPVVEIPLVGYCRDIVTCGLVVLQTDPQLPPAEHREKNAAEVPACVQGFLMMGHEAVTEHQNSWQ